METLSRYMEHICLTPPKIKKIDRLQPESNDRGKTWVITDEYEHPITFCPYCGARL